jgi:hypothetical protein
VGIFGSRLIIPLRLRQRQGIKGFSCDYREVCAINQTKAKCEFIGPIFYKLSFSQEGFEELVHDG